MKKKTRNPGVRMFAPVCLSLFSASTGSVWFAVLTFCCIFIVVAITPYCRRREGMWVFIITSVSSLPINIVMLNKYDTWKEFVLDADTGYGIIYYIVLFGLAVLLSNIETEITVFLSRVIWRKQYKIMPDDD